MAIEPNNLPTIEEEKTQPTTYDLIESKNREFKCTNCQSDVQIYKYCELCNFMFCDACTRNYKYKHEREECDLRKKTRGVISIKVMEGDLWRDVTTFGKMSTFVKLSRGDFSRQSTVEEETGKSPAYNCRFDFQIRDEHKKIGMEIWAKNAFADKEVGSAKLDI